jgi:glucose/mannose transport system permease protein
MANKGIHRTSRIAYPILTVALVFFLVPIYMAIITSLKEPSAINLSTAWIPPAEPYFRSFVDAFALIGPNIKNSLILTISATAISAFVGAINGFIFSKNKFRGSEIIYILFLFGLFIPYEIILIPLFQTLRTVGLYGSLTGLILSHVVYGIPIVTLIFRNFYETIPDSIVESAYLDGAGFFGLFFRLFLPLSAPAFVVVGIWQFTQIWNEFLWGVTLTRKDTNPITVAIAQLAGGEAVSWNLPMAGALIAGLPVLLIFIFLGKYFVRGLLSGSVKE